MEVVDLAGYNLGNQSTCSSVNKNISRHIFKSKIDTMVNKKTSSQKQLSNIQRELESHRDMDSNNIVYFK